MFTVLFWIHRQPQRLCNIRLLSNNIFIRQASRRRARKLQCRYLLSTSVLHTAPLKVHSHCVLSTGTLSIDCSIKPYLTLEEQIYNQFNWDGPRI